MAVTARPPETQYRLTRAWKDAVLRWLDENDRSKTWLAEQISRRYRVINSSTLTVLFRVGTSEYPEQWTSALVPIISDITGIPMPEMEVDARGREFLERLERVRASNPAGADAILKALESLDPLPKKDT